MVLKDFLSAVHDEVRDRMAADAASTGGAPQFAELVFTSVFARHMAERGITYDSQPCRYFASIDHHDLRLSGYALSDELDRLDAFVSVYSGDEEPRSISEQDALDAAEQCGRFLEMSARGTLAAHVDASHDAFLLISTIASAWSDMSHVRIHVLTDMCAGTMLLPSLEIGGKTVAVEVVDIERVFDQQQGAELQSRFRALSTFREEWMASIAVDVQASGESASAIFADDAAARLTDAEEFADFQRCDFNGTAAGRGPMRVNGHAFDDTDGTLALMVTDFSGAQDIDYLGTNDARLHFDMLETFIDASLHGDVSRDPGLAGTPIAGLAADIVRMRPGILRIRMYLVTDRLSDFGGELEGSDELSGIALERYVWDAARFHRASESVSGRDDLEVDFCVDGSNGVPALHAGSADGDYEGYLCTIGGAVLAAIYERHGSRLLEGNVRSFLSTKGKINSAIQTTISDKPEMFFAYNNGIAATAEAVEFDSASSRIVRAVNLQIVNGGQTTASLAAAWRAGHDLSKICVQMKLSVLSPARAGELIPLIARFANSQNKVNESDFFANHPYHHRIEQLSQRVMAPAVEGEEQTRWYYERSRGQYVNEQKNLDSNGKKRFLAINPKSQLLTKLDVAKYENTWKGLPHKVSCGAQKNFVFFAGWLAKRWTENDSAFDELYFRNLVAMSILFRHTERLVGEQPWYQGAYRANIVTYALAVLQFTVLKSGKGRQLDLDEIWKTQRVPDALSDYIASIAKAVLGVLTDPERPRANVTEWAKQEACWERARDAVVPLSEPVFDNLVDPISRKYAEGSGVQEVGYGVFARTAVLGIRPAQWEELRQWGAANAMLDAREAELLRSATRIPKFVPSVKECERIWSIRSKLIKEGFEEPDKRLSA
ncbi:AIPR family protein [Massilia sp. Dwa41.01b]|uniref:AIPR family protein n=1 Tax=unclassified Massilia TaxID=2609279 RepID=UPI00160213F3|nr:MULTISPECIES: AIPR family protein [unclassified Massilia]QNA87468.1 AIPR family protein [Massilia sp. Dwa41.01b]QNA98374.1 AIPR family protein [Massilia sp. Se16.2.3]